LSLVPTAETALRTGDDPGPAETATVSDMVRWSGLRAFVRGRPLLADTLFAAILYVGENALWFFGPHDLFPSSWRVALTWSLLGMAPLALRRRWPWVAVVALSAHAAASGVLTFSTEGLAIVVLTYTVAAHLPVRQSALATALLWLPALAISTVLTRYDDPPLQLSLGYFFAFNTMMLLLCFLAGRIIYTRRRYVAALEERAHTAEQNQRSLAAQAVAEERRRIARELHDMVAHHVSVMGVLATGSRRMLQRDSAAADEALATIEETGRTALREMRRLLDVLRTDPEPAGELAPQPGLAGLEALVEQVREAGLPVSLKTSGNGSPLEPAVALTVYRIVQEALTNVIKHAGSLATAEVRLDLGAQSLTLEVFDTGRGPVARADWVGHGLLGMRERVALYGGTLRTGPRPGGGFRVYARIPREEGAA
jgi:signal transduction histidine kinase